LDHARGGPPLRPVTQIARDSREIRLVGIGASRLAFRLELSNVLVDLFQPLGRHEIRVRTDDAFGQRLSRRLLIRFTNERPAHDNLHEHRRPGRDQRQAFSWWRYAKLSRPRVWGSS